MTLARLAFVAFVAALVFLVLFIADREKEAGVERLSNYKIPHSSLQANGSFKLARGSAAGPSREIDESWGYGGSEAR